MLPHDVLSDPRIWIWGVVYAALSRVLLNKLRVGGHISARGALVLGLFVAGAVIGLYPAGYGLRQAPALSALMTSPEAQPDQGLAVAWLLTLAVPLLPGTRHRLALWLTLQVILLSSFIFDALRHHVLMEHARLMPGYVTLALPVLVWSAQRAGRSRGHPTPPGLNLPGLLSIGLVALIYAMGVAPGLAP